MVEVLSQNFIKIDENKKSPEYEEFIKAIKIDLSLATERGVLIEFDSCFFGTRRDSDTSCIDYKIVDLDNIYTNTRKNMKRTFS